jgi:hypothetical protein
MHNKPRRPEEVNKPRFQRSGHLKERIGRVPRQVRADGGFASRNNLAFAEGHEVKDAVFAKKRGLSVIGMAKSGSRPKTSAHVTSQWIACGASSEAARNETVFLLRLKN